MGKNVTAKPGRYHISTAPYQKEPQESFTDPVVQVTVLYMAKRLGKTEIINNLHGSVIEQNPRNILHVMPTLDSAKKWSKQFFMPMVRGIAAFRSLIREVRSKDANNTILSKEFPGGTISAIGANSPSGFRQVQAPVVTCDEIDAMENGPEGDPVFLAFGRAENYSDSVQVVSSTATRRGTSRIEEWWLKSDQRKWFCPCPDCKAFHVLRWSQVKWPEPHQHNLAWYECPECGSKWDDLKRVWAVCNGEWRATAPFNGVRGYWLNGLNSTFPPKKGFETKLHQFAKDFYDAYKAGEAARIYWQNTFLCEAYEENTERIDHNPLLARVEQYTPQTLPVGSLVVTAQVDVQKDRVECCTIATGLESEAWPVESETFYGNTERGEAWPQLTEYLGKTFKRVDGIELSIVATAIDIRHQPGSVVRWVKTCGIPRVYPVYGIGKDQPVLVTRRISKHYKIRTFAVAANNAKDTLFARLRLPKAGPRYIHFPSGFGFDQEFFEQLTAEVVRFKFNKGHQERFYEKIRDRNEALDQFVYWLACLDILRPSFVVIAKRLLAKESETQAPEAGPRLQSPAAAFPQTPQPPPQPLRRPRFVPRPGRGFVNSWR